MIHARMVRQRERGGRWEGKNRAFLSFPCRKPRVIAPRIVSIHAPGDEVRGGTTKTGEEEEDLPARCKRGIISRRVSNLIASARWEGGEVNGAERASQKPRLPLVLLRYWSGCGMNRGESRGEDRVEPRSRTHLDILRA